MKKTIDFIPVNADDMTRETAQEYNAFIRMADTMAKKAAVMRSVLVECVESGKLRELFPDMENGENVYTIFKDSKTRNTIAYIPATTAMVTDTKAMEAYFLEHGLEIPKKEQARKATLRIN